MLKTKFEKFVSDKNIIFEVPKFGTYKDISPNFIMFLQFCGEQLMTPEIAFENLQNDSAFIEEFRAWYKAY
jgi:hypothetical protein